MRPHPPSPAAAPAGQPGGSAGGQADAGGGPSRSCSVSCCLTHGCHTTGEVALEASVVRAQMRTHTSADRRHVGPLNCGWRALRSRRRRWPGGERNAQVRFAPLTRARKCAGSWEAAHAGWGSASDWLLQPHQAGMLPQPGSTCARRGCRNRPSAEKLGWCRSASSRPAHRSRPDRCGKTERAQV